eukprot:Em0002g1475a
MYGSDMAAPRLLLVDYYKAHMTDESKRIVNEKCNTAMDGSENDIMFSHVAGMNCHMPAALALDTACGLKALSTKGKNTSSVRMPRNSNSST